MARLALVLTVLASLLVVAVMALPPQGAELRAEFADWAIKYQKSYSSEEFEHRLAVYTANLERIEYYQSNDVGATYAPNKFADLTEEEFRSRFVSSRVDAQAWDEAYGDRRQTIDDETVLAATPSAYDWRTRTPAVVTPVKNQGQCGSCWAFSTTGNLEGQWALAGHPLVGLSEQNLVDCDTLDEGCNGGLPSNAYQYIMKEGGIDSESSYPYEGVDGKCRWNQANSAATVSNWTAVSQNETQIAAFSLVTGPLSIGINAGWMQFYSHGVSDPPSLLCDPNKLDHGVLIVGWGVESSTTALGGSKPYWIIKNSWGADWGMSGYYEVLRGDCKCGLCKMVTSSIVDA